MLELSMTGFGQGPGLEPSQEPTRCHSGTWLFRIPSSWGEGPTLEDSFHFPVLFAWLPRTSWLSIKADGPWLWSGWDLFSCSFRVTWWNKGQVIAMLLVTLGFCPVGEILGKSGQSMVRATLKSIEGGILRRVSPSKPRVTWCVTRWVAHWQE